MGLQMTGYNQKSAVINLSTVELLSMPATFLNKFDSPIRTK
jgi:hypothetical protein